MRLLQCKSYAENTGTACPIPIAFSLFSPRCRIRLLMSPRSGARPLDLVHSACKALSGTCPNAESGNLPYNGLAILRRCASRASQISKECGPSDVSYACANAQNAQKTQITRAQNVAQSFVVAWPPISGGGTMLLAIWFIGSEPESGSPLMPPTAGP